MSGRVRVMEDGERDGRQAEATELVRLRGGEGVRTSRSMSLAGSSSCTLELGGRAGRSGCAVMRAFCWKHVSSWTQV